MIKLIHLADVHIGMENYGRLNPETGLNTRLHDFLDTLDEAVDRAIAEQVPAAVASPRDGRKVGRSPQAAQYADRVAAAMLHRRFMAKVKQPRGCGFPVSLGVGCG